MGKTYKDGKNYNPSAKPKNKKSQRNVRNTKYTKEENELNKE